MIDTALEIWLICALVLMSGALLATIAALVMVTLWAWRNRRWLFP